MKTFAVKALNQLSNVTRSGTLTVSGATLGSPTTVKVNSSNSALYVDAMFASTNHTPADGSNTFTAVASNAAFTNSNAITAWLPTNQVFAYDLNGNLLSDGRQALGYDDENQLISVMVTNAWKSEFTYDGKMRLRVAKEFAWSPGSGVWVLGTETRYVYDGMLCIQERDSANARTITFTRGRDLSGSLEGAGGIGGLLAMTDHRETAPSVATAYYHCDGNGNVTALVNTNQIVVARYAYDPYGNTLSISGPRSAVNRYRFSSKEQHERSGLYSFGRRFYAPELQRWLNRDPIGEIGGINLYRCVFNDSLNRSDAFGLWRIGDRYDSSAAGYSTIVCDGNGGIAVALSDKMQYDCCVGDCTRAHEEEHRKDALAANPNVCKLPSGGNWRYGWVVDPSSIQEKIASEIKGTKAEIACLEAKLEDPPPGCLEDITNRLKKTYDELDAYKKGNLPGE